jgi:hypothetical protein
MRDFWKLAFVPISKHAAKRGHDGDLRTLTTAVDQLVDEGALKLTGYQRQTPTYEELSKLTTSELSSQGWRRGR